MKKTFTYKAFDLIFNSEFEIPELIKSEKPSNIKIVLDKVPKNLKIISKQGVKYQASENEFLLEVDGIARYYVKNGNQIIVELIKDKADKEVRLFLLGSAFGALFLQRGLLPIHGSAIKLGSSATVFTGISGVGKSTMAAYFVNQGFLALADDISVVNEQLELVPGFPSLKIWSDVLQKLEIKNNSLKEIRPNIKKFQLPITENFFTENLKLKNVVILSTKNTSGFEFEELTGIKKFNALKNNTYRYRFVQGMERQLNHFQILNKLLPKIKVYKFTRPLMPMSLSKFGDFMLKNLEMDV